MQSYEDEHPAVVLVVQVSTSHRYPTAPEYISCREFMIHILNFKIQAFPAIYEGLVAYERANIAITDENVAAFKQMSLEDLLKFRHVKIAWPLRNRNLREEKI